MLKTLGISLHDLPPVRVLGNGRYTVMLHDQGGGWSRLLGLALNDWVWDGQREQGGLLIYVRDLDSGEVVVFGAGQGTGPGTGMLAADGATVEVRERRADLELRMRVHVAAAHDSEVRELTLRSLAAADRRVAVTVYLPLALQHPGAQRAHPVFSRLFVQTERLASSGALLARRRPRAQGEAAPCCVARLLGPGELRWETDRARFLGRGWGLWCPRGIVEGLEERCNNVLDPAFALQRELPLAARGEAHLTFILGAALDREAAVALADLPLEALAPAVGASDAVESTADVLAESLAGRLLYRRSDAGLDSGRSAAALKDSSGQPLTSHSGVVWGWGMPTDRPFVLVQNATPGQVVAAANLQRGWRALGLDLPVLVLTTTAPDASGGPDGSGVPGVEGLVVRPLAAVPAHDLAVLRAVAGLVCGGTEGTGLASAAGVTPAGSLSPLTSGVGAAASVAADVTAPDVATPDVTTPDVTTPDTETLRFDNGCGGFSADGSEYVIRLRWHDGRLRLPPLPWINVLANPGFGTLVSETGAGCTWSVNSHQRRLTPWANDPVLDPPQETLWLQDLGANRQWSPLPIAGEPAYPEGGLGGKPLRTCSPPPYEVRHGFGRSVFLHTREGLRQRTTVFVHRSLPVKIVRLEITELLGRPRTLRLTARHPLVLGFQPEETRPHLQVGAEPARRLLLARNPLAGDFAGRVTFATLVTGGELQQPYWNCGEGRDFHQQLRWSQAAGGTVAVSILFGDVASETDLEALLTGLDSDEALRSALAEVEEFWTDLLGTVQVETPVPAIDVMLNGWLLYQTLACRMWGRTALYQSSGAFGFRDQLQDSGAFLTVRPELTRSQILLHASRQFVEGDVQHWWHEAPLDRGLRTRFADDLNWLPLLTAQYIEATGDHPVLDETIPFLTARTLAEGEDEAYLQAVPSGESASLYEHCCRALDRSLTRGRHGLPLMGTGDWNDGMNRVGREGLGESVWMGFFLYDILGRFVPLCEARRDGARVERYRAYREHLFSALNADGWDGQWYRRAWYDNGEPLGSVVSDECRIDALAQAWAVLSGAAPDERAEQALDALDSHLIDREGGLIRLLTPPFVDTPNDPGYIKGYVAGVRENGGQYTHAAAWVVKAMAERNRREAAAELFEMLLPVSHARDAAGVARYQTEPYAVVADVYGTEPHVGRGGWTWYTGSCGWLYRVGLESLLGLRLVDGDTLLLKPCLPDAWPGYRASYRTRNGGTLRIEVFNGGSSGVPATVTSATVVSTAATSVSMLSPGLPLWAELDGKPLTIEAGAVRIPLADLSRRHTLRVGLSGRPDA